MNKPFPPPITPDPTLPSSPIPGVPGPAVWQPGQTAQNETPISLLPPADPATGGEQVPMVQNGITVRMALGQIGTQAGPPGPTGPAGPIGVMLATVSASPPSAPAVGTMWFDGVGAQMYCWYDDGTSQQWVPIVNQVSALAGLATYNGLIGLSRSTFPVVSVAASGATPLNWASGEVQQITLNANATISVSNWPAAGNLAKLVLDIKNTGGFGITGWPAGTVWPGGTAPTITSGAGAQDVVMLMTFDGGATVLGSVIGQGYH